jgi:hypothetical protein
VSRKALDTVATEIFRILAKSFMVTGSCGIKDEIY